MKIHYVFLPVIMMGIYGCSAEYLVGKILVVDETRDGVGSNISETAESLLKELKNIKAVDPSKSNSTIKITISETGSLKGTSRDKKRFHILLILTASQKDGSIQIFQSESTTTSEIDKADTFSQIKGLLYDSLLKLDYQCTIRKKQEKELFSIFNDKKTDSWQREAILEEVANRISQDDIKDRETVWNFIFQTFTTKKKEYGEKIIGILSSTDISKFNLNEDQTNLLAKEIIRYCIGKETHIQMHTITILSRLKNDIARSFIFTLSTGSTNQTIRNQAKEIIDELETNNKSSFNTFTSK